MSNEEKKPTQKFGSINQWRSLGSGKEEGEEKEMSNALTQQRTNVETQKRQRTTSYVRKSDNVIMKRQTVFLPEELADRLKIYAARKHDDMSSIIEQLVAEFLEDKEP